MTRYAYLGPAGTFTQSALATIAEPGDISEAYGNVTATLNAVRTGKVDCAIVPIENSVEGVVALTLDELANGEPLVITGEITIPVSFSLMAKDALKLEAITRIATHPHAEAQCRKFLASKLPHADVVAASSTAAAAANVAAGIGDYQAAIAAPAAASHYNLKVLAEDIGDIEGAVTRFIVVSKPGAVPARTGNDRTSLVTYIGADHAGALLEILTEFATRGVNLTFIQSRPTGLELGHYHFIIDAEGHIDDENVGQAIDGLRRICEDVRLLGSYPRGVR